MKTAIVHDWLVTFAGAERVLEQMLQVFPEADIFSVVDFLPQSDRQFLHGKKITTTFIQKLPAARKRYRTYLPLMPLAIEQLDLSAYDLVISSTHAVAKGVITGPNQLHLSYVYSPIRYAWDLQHQYLREAGLERGPASWFARTLLHYVRVWDVRTSNLVDAFACDSHYIARRIRKFYGRDAAVIYPPVRVADTPPQLARDDFYLTASRMVPYKRIPLIVDAFSRMPNRRLLVIGDGPEMPKVRALAAPNIEVLGFRSTTELQSLMARARAFVFAAEEDFGITPVEAQALGAPVIAFGRGGAAETIIDRGPEPTGIFFQEQSPEAICDAVERFEQHPPIDSLACWRNAQRFSE